MSDEKNDIDTGFEEKLAEIVGKKSRNRSNHNIYERFISRVQGDEDGDDSENKTLRPLDDTDQSFAYESLSTHTFERFTNQEDKEPFEATSTTDATFDFSDQEIPTNSNANIANKAFGSEVDDDALTFDFYDDTDSSSQAVDASLTNASPTGYAATDDSAYTRNDNQPVIPEPSIPSAIQAASAQDRLASSKKPLIIGMIFGSLLIVMIVLALIYTGILSTPIQTAAPDSTEINSASESDKAAPDNSPAVAVNTTPTSSNPVEQPVVKTQDTAVGENAEATDNSKTAEALPAESSTDAKDLGAEAAITYEDFREESQNTLYRESND